MKRLYLPNADATQALGRTLGHQAFDGLVMAVTGDLGAGKTTFAQGVAQGMGVPPDHYVNSPTFAIMLSHPGTMNFHHIDLYRLGDLDEAYAIGLDQVIGVDGVTYIEWPSRLPELIPSPHLAVELSYDGDGRRISFIVQGPTTGPYESLCALLNTL